MEGYDEPIAPDTPPAPEATAPEAPAAEEAPAPQQPTRSLVPPENLAEHEIQCSSCGAIFSKGDTACPNCHKPNQP